MKCFYNIYYITQIINQIFEELYPNYIKESTLSITGTTLQVKDVCISELGNCLYLADNKQYSLPELLNYILGIIVKNSDRNKQAEKIIIDREIKEIERFKFIYEKLENLKSSILKDFPIKIIGTYVKKSLELFTITPLHTKDLIIVYKYPDEENYRIELQKYEERHIIMSNRNKFEDSNNKVSLNKIDEYIFLLLCEKEYI